MIGFISSMMLTATIKIYSTFLIYFSAYCMYHKILAKVFWFSIRMALNSLYCDLSDFMWLVFWYCDAVYWINRQFLNIQLREITVLIANSTFGFLLVEVNVHTQRITAIAYSLPSFNIKCEWYRESDEEYIRRKKGKKLTLMPVRPFTDDERRMFFEREQKNLPIEKKKTEKYMPKKKPNEGKAPNAIRKTKKTARL